MLSTSGYADPFPVTVPFRPKAGAQNMKRLIFMISIPLIALAFLLVYAWWPWTSEDLVAYMPSYLRSSPGAVILLGGCCAPLLACSIYTGVVVYAWRENFFPISAYLNYGSSVLGYAAAMGPEGIYNRLSCLCLALSAATTLAAAMETASRRRAKAGALLCGGLLAGVILQYLFMVSMTLSKGV
jgi:hypothetical protein